ncbi:MAG TPA: MFS transporter [Chryseosolibacter sp.]|nr:MFS transporter [Chryseosolibacter sp.]
MDNLKSNHIGLRASSFAALALAFASLGDAFLYPFLPVNFNLVGIPVAWVGLLLSVNRFVRIISNTIMVHAFARYGLRTVMIIAALTAITSTLGYALATGLLLWLIFRIMWGLAFSAMRIGTLGYALQQQRKGFALGLSRSLQESGPMLSLFLAPILLTSFDSVTIFYILASLSLPAVYFAWKLPVAQDRTQSIDKRSLLHWPSPLNAITLISAIIVDGIVVVVLGVLFLHYRNEVSLITATTLAAFYLGYRRVCLVVLSPAGGWIADKAGLDTVFNLSMLLVIAGLVIILSGWIGTGAVIVFTFYSINAAVAPGSASTVGPHALAAVAENATWRDIGAAVGTLMGGLLIASSHISTVLVAGVFLLAFLLLLRPGTTRRYRFFDLWN